MAKKSDRRQKRANRNRARRAALEARSSGGPVKRPSRIAPSTAERLEREPRSSTRSGEVDPADAPEAGSKRRTRTPRERPPRLGDRPVDLDTLEGSFLRKVSHVPGGLQVIMTVGLAVIVAVLIGNAKVYKTPGLEGKDDPFTMTVFDRLGTVPGALLLGLPVAATLVALAFSLHPQRRRFWTGAAVVIFMAMLVNPLVLMNFLVVGGFLFYASWRSRRIEDPPAPRTRRRAASEQDDDADGDGDDDHDVDVAGDESG